MQSLSSLYPQIEEQAVSCESDSEYLSKNGKSTSPLSQSPGETIPEEKRRSRTHSLTLLMKKQTNKPTESLPLSQLTPQEDQKKSPKMPKQLAEMQHPSPTPGRAPRGRSASYSAKLLEQGREMFGRKRSNSTDLEKSPSSSVGSAQQSTDHLKSDHLEIEAISPLLSDEVRNWVIYCDRKSSVCEKKLNKV